jgi:O-Antigen ligase
MLPFQIGYVPFLSGLLVKMGNLSTAEFLLYLLFAAWAAMQLMTTHGGRTRGVRTPHLWWLFGLLVGGILAAATGTSADKALVWQFFRVACVAPLVLYVLVIQLVHTLGEVRQLVAWILAIGAVFGLFLIGARFWGDWVPGSLQAGRLEGQVGFLGLNVGVTTNTTCAYYGVLWLAGLALWLLGGSSRLCRLTALALPIYAVCMLLLATRSVWILVVVGSLAIFLFGVNRRGWMPTKRLNMVLVGCGLFVAAVIGGWIGSSEGIRGRLVTLTSWEALVHAPNAVGRVATWPDLWRMWLNEPFGMGFFYELPGWGMSVHSLYFLLLVSTGFIGLICYLGFQLGCLRDGRRCMGSQDAFVGALGVGGSAGIALVLIYGVGGAILWRANLNLSIAAVAAAMVAARGVESGWLPQRRLHAARSRRGATTGGSWLYPRGSS